MMLTGRGFVSTVSMLAFTLVDLSLALFSYSVNVGNPRDIRYCRGTKKDYDLKGSRYYEIYSSGRLQTSLCQLAFESESYPYKLMVDFRQTVRANRNSDFFILLQTKNSKYSTWGRDTKITPYSHVSGPLYFSRRLLVTISGNVGDEVYFRIRVRPMYNSHSVGVVSGLANWSIGVIVSGLLIFLCFMLCGFFMCRRYRSGQSLNLFPSYFNRRSAQPPVVAYNTHQPGMGAVFNAPPPTYPSAPYPVQTSYPVQTTYPVQQGVVAQQPPPPGFAVNQPPPPYSPTPK